jgi:hypothetical protein
MENVKATWEANLREIADLEKEAEELEADNALQR